MRLQLGRRCGMAVRALQQRSRPGRAAAARRRSPRSAHPVSPSPGAARTLFLRFLRKLVGLATVVYVLTTFTLSPIPKLIVQSESATPLCTLPPPLLPRTCVTGLQRCFGRAMLAAQLTAVCAHTGVCPVLPSPLPPVKTAQSIYYFLSIACDALGAAVTTCLGLNVAPSFGSPFTADSAAQFWNVEWNAE